MYQRKDKSERIVPGCHEDVLDLFRLLESSDPEEVESVKNVIHENLSTAKDSRLLNCIVDYYLAIHSEKALEILVRVKDPHDKHLFDKINELMKSASTCYDSLQFLCSLVYKQPSWIYKIANHRIMHSLFNLLKTDMNVPNLISALLIVVCLLPMIPSQFGPLLSDTFDVFSRLIAWNVKKPSAIAENYVLHLQVGVYSLFHRLYGMFPCNFLAYLRSYYGGRDYSEENFKVFTYHIKPMLERVKLHPLLVTASKETELNVNRWKKKEYHDVITECASISLDAIEGTLDGLRGRNQNSLPRRHSNICTQNSLQYVSLSSQSSVTSVTVEPGSLVNDAVSSHRDSLWSPSHVYGSGNVSSSAVTSSSKSELQGKNMKTQVSVDENVPLDLAVEAKPEEVKSEEEAYNVKQKLVKTPSKESNSELKLSSESKESDAHKDLSQSFEKDSKEISSSGIFNSSSEKNILQGVEAKEEEIDKEVDELTSSQNKSIKDITDEVRYDTPFCSTTQNLTDEPKILATSSVSKSDKPEKLPSHDDVDEMYNSIEDDAYIPPYSHFRCLSQCDSADFCSASHISVPDTIDADNNASNTVAVASTNNNVITTTSAFVTVSNNVILSTSTNLTYEHLIPMAMEPLPDINQPPSASLESNYYSYNPLFGNFSPPELLDNYIQHGNVAYLNQINSIPITSTKSTDWTHFGGKPPPDEVEILRNQILLLHNQLLFERHRKDVHSERIRRILGRAKKSRMQEELIIALKEQINLLEKDNEDLKYELSRNSKLLQKHKADKKQIETDLNSLLIKFKQENDQLQFANKKLQSLLVTQKEENDNIISDCKLYQSKIFDLEAEFDLCKQELNSCRNLRKEAEFLSKKLFLLQEINSLYQQRIDRMKEPSNENIGNNLLNEAASIEINDLKMKLESTCMHLDASKSKITELEELISNLKVKQKEQCDLIENIKSFHKDQIKLCEERLADQKRIAIFKDTQILELYKDKEILSKKLNALEKKLNSDMESSQNSCDMPPCQEGISKLEHFTSTNKNLNRQNSSNL